MVLNGSKAGVTAPPPHELKVWNFAESRAPELESLHSVVSDRLDNNFRSQRNKRRRTTGHDDRVGKKKFRKRRGGIGDADKIDSSRKHEKKLSRRARRKIELKKNPPSGFGTSGDGTKRLRTHVWHAKRFTMTKLWGFHIPLGLHGRGRGSRALLKKLKHGVLVHDASYYGCVQLEGPKDTLMSVLSSVLVLPPSASCEEISHDILCGAIFGTAMLHNAGEPCFPLIALVDFMWRPLQHGTMNAEGHHADVLDEQTIDKGNVIRQLWVWIHAAAFEEAYDALRAACERQTGMTRSANCVSLEGKLAKLELMGSKVFHLLQKTLLPARWSENSWRHLRKCSADEQHDHAESKNISILENGNQISSSSVVSLVVKDPRVLTDKENSFVTERKHVGLISDEECQIKEQAFLSLLKHETECVLEYNDLWDVGKGVLPPVEDNVLCLEKHNRHKEFFRLNNKCSGFQNVSADENYSRVCPILIMKNENHDDSITRCSIIVPLSWVKAFWVPFISNGAHAIGLREKHWVACEMGLPYFPWDFPDCKAYSQLMAMEAVAFNDKSKLLPPPKRQPVIPIPPPWDCVHCPFEKESNKVVNSHNQAAICSQDEKIDNTAKNSDCHGVPFEGIIARTSSMFSDFLKNVGGNHLLLFPEIRDQNSCLNKFMMDEEFLKQKTVISELKYGKTQCFVRVLLRACKDGVFEQGAVVCAPHAADIKSWTARSESDGQQLQLPHSLLKSHFTQLPSGKWELQVPEDLALYESYRWPIGFITTGFVRGSKKGMAGAFCEASLLSKLREEQWKALLVRQRKKQIYVLVRNMRSTAYRLALATIVLEQQEEDVKFL